MACSIRVFFITLLGLGLRAEEKLLAAAGVPIHEQQAVPQDVEGEGRRDALEVDEIDVAPEDRREVEGGLEHLHPLGWAAEEGREAEVGALRGLAVQDRAVEPERIEAEPSLEPFRGRAHLGRLEHVPMLADSRPGPRRLNGRAKRESLSPPRTPAYAGGWFLAAPP